MGTVLQHRPRGTDFGEFLRVARERRGLTLRQVSNETKIPWRHLEAFEHGDLTFVPNGMYRRAEVRAYARAVGLDQTIALAELEHALLVSGMASDRTPEPQPESGPQTARHPVLATLATVAVAAILLLTLQVWTRKPAERPAVPATSPVNSAASDAVPAAAQPSAPAQPSAVTQPSAPAQPSAAAQPYVGPSFRSAEPAAPTTTAAANPDNALVVTTDPAGARVTVDGIGWGTTPVTIRFLSPGDKVVRVIKDGYASEERSVRIISGRSTSIHVSLGLP